MFHTWNILIGIAWLHHSHVMVISFIQLNPHHLMEIHSIKIPCKYPLLTKKLTSYMNDFHTKSELSLCLVSQNGKMHVSLSQFFKRIFKMYIITLKNTVNTLRLFNILTY